MHDTLIYFQNIHHVYFHEIHKIGKINSLISIGYKIHFHFIQLISCEGIQVFCENMYHHLKSKHKFHHEAVKTKHIMISHLSSKDYQEIHT